MRLKVGDAATLFDGSGAEFAARVASTSRSSLEMEILERREISRERAGELVLAVALPKGDRQKWLVEKATELGVSRLVPLVTKRAVAQPAASALKRLQRGIVEASKQCGRNRLMQLADPLPLAELLATVPTEATRLLAHPGGEPLNTSRSGESCWVAIGPEGGFTEDEATAALAAGWQRISLGPRILRIETAALAVAALLGD